MLERTFACAGLVVLLGLPARAGDRPASGPASENPAAGARPSAGVGEGSPNRNRWDKLSPEERDRLREIYRRLQKLPPAERERLLEKLRAMPAKERKKSIEMARERLRVALDRSEGSSEGKREGTPRAEQGPGPMAFPIPPEARRRLQGLPPEERKREAQKIYQDVFRRWLKTLPRDLSERVKRFTPREQLEFFRAYRQSEMLFRTFPEEGEEEALLALPAGRLRSLVRPGSERPEGISASSWESWRKLAPSGRLRIIRRLESLREERGVLSAPNPPEGASPTSPGVPSASP